MSITRKEIRLVIREAILFLENIDAIFRDNHIDLKIDSNDSLLKKSIKAGERSDLKGKIIYLIENNKNQTTGMIINRCNKYKRLDVIEALIELESKGFIRHEKTKKSEKWFLV